MNVTIRNQSHRLASTVRLGLATAAVAAAIAGFGAASASASPLPSTGNETDVKVFQQDLKPWQSVGLPAFTCPAGSYLLDQQLSPGDNVIDGLERQSDNSIAVAINAPNVATVQNGSQTDHPYVGSVTGGINLSSATNWDLFHDHELTIIMKCTTDLNDAANVGD